MPDKEGTQIAEPIEPVTPAAGDPPAQEPQGDPKGDPQGGEPQGGEPQGGEAEGGEPQGGEPQVDPRDAEISTLKTDVARLEGRLDQAGKTPAQDQQPRKYTDQEIAEYEEKTGMTWTGITWVEKMFKDQETRLEKKFSGQMGSISRNGAIDELAKQPGFSDVNLYRKEMQEHMDDMFDPAVHNNPRIVKSAYFNAKGQHANKDITKARNSSEFNRKIAGGARPASPGAGGRGSGSVKLTDVEESARKAFNMSAEEYAKYAKKGAR